jgi:hypothetical protein
MKDETAYAWAFIVSGLIYDVLLAHQKKPLITHVLRTKRGKVFVVLLTLHVFDKLGKADPFTLLGLAAKWSMPKGPVL